MEKQEQTRTTTTNTWNDQTSLRLVLTAPPMAFCFQNNDPRCGRNAQVSPKNDPHFLKCARLLWSFGSLGALRAPKPPMGSRHIAKKCWKHIHCMQVHQEVRNCVWSWLFSFFCTLWRCPLLMYFFTFLWQNSSHDDRPTGSHRMTTDRTPHPDYKPTRTFNSPCLSQQLGSGSGPVSSVREPHSQNGASPAKTGGESCHWSHLPRWCHKEGPSARRAHHIAVFLPDTNEALRCWDPHHNH